MSGETTITVVGNLVADPDMRFTPAGVPVANFTIASTPRVFKDGTWSDSPNTLFMRCSIWRDYAEHVAASLKKGDMVIAIGDLVQRTYDTKDDTKVTVVEMQVREIGPALRFLNLPERTGTGGTARGEVSRVKPDKPNPDDDPWATPAPTDQPQF